MYIHVNEYYLVHIRFIIIIFLVLYNILYWMDVTISSY
jgi:hypothetical protein